MPSLTSLIPGAAAGQAGNQNRQFNNNGGTQNNVEGSYFAAQGNIIFNSSKPGPEEHFLQVLIADYGQTRAKIVLPEPGTCSWILEDSEFLSWKTSSGNRPLWINGNPGFGKSVISSFILKSRQQWIPHPESTSSSEAEKPKKTIVVGCFCDGDMASSEIYAILRIILHDILNANRELLRHVMSSPEFWHGFDTPHPIMNEESVESLDFLASLLGKIAGDEGISGLYLIVDGHYERGGDEQKLAEIIKKVSAHCSETASPHWLISTRPNGFNTTMGETYVVDLSSKNGSDISLVAAARMERLRRANPTMEESVRDAAVQMLIERTDGMFLWLSLALNSLEKRKMIWDMKSIEEALEKIPYNVQAIYGQAFDDADENTQSMMRWIFIAGRPLKVSEILVMLAIKSGAKSSREIKQRAQNPATLRGLVESNLKSLLSLHEDDTIHLAHPSVTDFLRHCLGDVQQHSPGAGSKHMTKAAVHKELAHICLAYLSLDEIRSLQPPEPPVDDNNMIDQERRAQAIEEYLGGHVFLEYSITFLGLHLRESNTDDFDIEGVEDFFGSDSAALQNWVKGYDLLMRWTSGKYTGASSSISLLFISARLNLTVLAKRALQSDNLKAALPGVSNFLGVGAIVGGISSLGLVRGQILDMPDMKGWRALHIAVDSESEDVVKWLLEQGAAVDGQTMGFIRPGRTALHIAASKSSDRSVRIVRELLSKGADPSDPTLFGGNTPLHYAVQTGSVETVKALMSPKKGRFSRSGADPNETNYSGISPFHKAVVIPGMEAIVEVMLDHDANPENPSRLDKVAVVKQATALTAGTIVKTAMSLNPVNMYTMAVNTFREVVASETSLHMAVRTKGTGETVKKLLEWYKNHNMKIKTKDSMGRTALHSAMIGEDFITNVKLLVESGLVSEINSLDANGKPPVLAYIGKASSLAGKANIADLKETLTILINAGADPTIKDDEETTSIVYAQNAGLTWALDVFNVDPDLPAVDDTDAATASIPTSPVEEQPNDTVETPPEPADEKELPGRFRKFRNSLLSF